MLALACSASEPDVASAPPQDEVTPVVVARPERRTLEDVFLDREATLYQVAEATVSTRQEGFVRSVLPEVGDLLHAGDLIAELDPTELNLRIAELRARVGRERTGLEVEESNWKRVQELYQREIVAEGERERARGRVDSARARVAEAQARLHSAEQDLAELRIVAPIPGLVTALSTDEGEYVSRGAVVAHLKRIDAIIALCTVSERFLGEVHEGGPAVVEVSAFPGKSFPGLIWKVVGDALLESRSFPVKVLVANPGLELKPGMSARISFRRQVDDAVLVPKDAVLDPAERPHVFVVREGKAERREVELGAPIGDRWHARTGVAPEDLVVITGNEDLRPGGLVKVVELPPSGEHEPGAEKAARPDAAGS
jgi:RND family efflux transporter MFP subunit